MTYKIFLRRSAAVLGGFCLALTSSGQATSQGIVVRVLAEVEIHSSDGDRGLAKLVPASRVVPGDVVIYTLEIRNAGPHEVVAPTVAQPIPNHMSYLADSASGPGAEISYSIDGGRTFASPEQLFVSDEEGHRRIAKPMDYSNIQWKLRKILKSKSVAFARFLAVVK